MSKSKLIYGIDYFGRLVVGTVTDLESRTGNYGGYRQIPREDAVYLFGAEFVFRVENGLDSSVVVVG